MCRKCKGMKWWMGWTLFSCSSLQHEKPHVAFSLLFSSFCLHIPPALFFIRSLPSPFLRWVWRFSIRSPCSNHTDEKEKSICFLYGILQLGIGGSAGWIKANKGLSEKNERCWMRLTLNGTKRQMMVGKEPMMKCTVLYVTNACLCILFNYLMCVVGMGGASGEEH